MSVPLVALSVMVSPVAPPVALKVGVLSLVMLSELLVPVSELASRSGTPGAEGALNGTQIELVEPLPGNTSIQGFLDKNPSGGQHHVCYEVPDIHAAKAEFDAMGKRVLGEPRIGAHGTLIFFVHPKDMQGVLTEIMEVAASGGH